MTGEDKNFGMIAVRRGTPESRQCRDRRPGGRTGGVGAGRARRTLGRRRSRSERGEAIFRRRG